MMVAVSGGKIQTSLIIRIVIIDIIIFVLKIRLMALRCDIKAKSYE